MSPAERREMIVRAALPLVAAHGAAVTTGQVARAAGIGEATIFRAFSGKDELLDACVAEALRADDILAEVAAIPLDRPLPARLAEAGVVIEAYLSRMGMVMGALHASGRPSRRPSAGAGHDHEAAMTRTREALAGLFEPERDRLRLPAEQVAGVFMGLMLTRSRPPAGLGAPLPPLEACLDVFLHGALKEDGTDQRAPS